MKCMRGLWAGACLLLVFSGCSKNPTGSVKDTGVYSPLITGIAADKEPAVRGVANEFTVLVTNVNGYPITYHWSAAAGTVTDSTGATAVWDAPNAIGTYPITVSIVSDGGGAHFFKTTTFQVFVDNDFTRWTRSSEVQFDPDPTPSGGVLFAQFRSIVTGAADAYNLASPSLSPVQLTQNFAVLASPTMRADELQIAFSGRRTTTDSLSVWVLPATGGDPSTAVAAAQGSSEQITAANSRFARTDRWLLYNSDSTSIFNPKPWFRDGNLSAQPQRVIQQGVEGVSSFWQPSWGPDVDGNGLPDWIVCAGYKFFRAPNQQSRGLFKFPTTPEQSVAVQWLPDSSAAEADWSPDGQHIIYTKRNAISGDRDIWIINAGSSDPSTAVRVTFGPADDSHPRFSHDGASIFFVSNRVDHYGLNGIYNTERRGTNIWSVSLFDTP
jgi:hypothetical protein